MKTVDTELFKTIKSVLDSDPGKVVIVSHQNPDGDAVGSAVGLGNILFNRGFEVTVVFPNDYPAYYNWITSKPEILFYNSKKEKVKKLLAESNLLICVDFNDISRTRDMDKALAKFQGQKIMIDHHPQPQDFCDYIFSDTSYSSTAEMIYEFIRHTGMLHLMDTTVAESLYTGIMTDTGSFSHNISNPNTFKTISELLELGIRADEIHSKVYHNYSAERMKLLGYCLNEKMEVLPEFKTALISITQAELKKFNFRPGDTEGFVNYPLSIGGVVFSVLLIEKENHVKLSFRSKGSFPANAFSAKYFNGGGHLNAAGGEINDSINNTLEKIRQLLPSYLHQLNNA